MTSPAYSHRPHHTTLDQVIAGRGVMLAIPAMDDSPFTYDLILPATGSTPPTEQRFIDWLVEEAVRFRGEVG